MTCHKRRAHSGTGAARVPGSALASIGLTIPAVAVAALVIGVALTLGVDSKSSVLLLTTLFLAVSTLSTGRTAILAGIVHPVILATCLFLVTMP